MGDKLKHPRMKSVVCLGTLALVFFLALGEGSQDNYEAIESKVFDRLIRDAGKKEVQKYPKSRKGSRKNKPKKKAGKRLRQRRKKGNGKARKQRKIKQNKGKGKRIGKSKGKNRRKAAKSKGKNRRKAAKSK